MHLPGIVIAGLYRQLLVEPVPGEAEGEGPVQGKNEGLSQPAGSGITEAAALQQTEHSISGTGASQITAAGDKAAALQQTEHSISGTGATAADEKQASLQNISAGGAGVAARQQSEAGPAPSQITITEPEQAPGSHVSATPPRGYKFLGNNSKKVVAIVDFPGEIFLPERHLQFLSKILGACKMNLGDIAIVNHASQPIVIHILKQQLQPAHILLFGPAPTDIQLPLSFPPYKQQSYDSCQYLYASSLDELNQETEEGKQLKGKLWTCLKKMFDV